MCKKTGIVLYFFEILTRESLSSSYGRYTDRNMTLEITRICILQQINIYVSHMSAIRTIAHLIRLGTQSTRSKEIKVTQLKQNRVTFIDENIDLKCYTILSYKKSFPYELKAIKNVTIRIYLSPFLIVFTVELRNSKLSWNTIESTEISWIVY